jgi:predicted Zn finger-like uncharacterized protein
VPKSRTSPLLIVCPNCATSYRIDPASLGPGGRTVRCARCKTTWFAGWQKPAPNESAFVEGVIAEVEAESGAAAAQQPPPQAEPAAESWADAEEAGEQAPAEASPAEEAPPAEWTAEEPAAALEAVDLDEAPSLVPTLEYVPDEPHVPQGEPSDSDDVESYTARRQRMQARRKKARRSPRWTAAVLVLFALNVTLIGARNDVVRNMPQTASLFAAIGLPVNLRHLRFDNVRISRERQDGVNILVVEGTIVSTSDRPVTVPRLRFTARDAAGQEIYTWTALPSRSVLGPGEHVDFRSRLASPPADAKNVLVRFFNARDAALATK